MPFQIAKTYAPVVHARKLGAFSATALVGTHSAVIGWDMDPDADRLGLLGFAVRRTDFDPDTGEMLRLDWLKGQKRFECMPDAGLDVRTNEAPFQRFHWNDYTLEADKSYLYEIFPAFGAPCALELGAPLQLRFRPSTEVVDDVGIYFNRGVTSAQAYLDRFKGAHPNEVDDGAAYAWLSRGLKESLIDFIGRAGRRNQLHVAIYEFHDAEIAAALKEAVTKQKADVEIVVHATGDRATEHSKSILKKHGLEGHARLRTNAGNLNHNKFVVLLSNGTPEAVWTGSANFSENAFHFQTNNALVLPHTEIARIYEDYYQVLRDDPTLGRAKKGVELAQDRVEAVIAAYETPEGLDSEVLFSPVRRDHVIDATIELLGAAKSAVFVSAPFAMEKPIVEALGRNDARILEYGLVNATAKRKIDGLKRKYTRFITPSVLKTYMGRTWDAKAFGAHKIHSKLVIIDPWGKDPAILVGSSNHSDEACRKNDENNLLIRGDKRTIAVMTTEFLRMYDHYKSRDFINSMQGNTAPPEDKYLKVDGRWAKTSFDPQSRSHKFRDREVFAGKS
jgi:phosphatidylserine/phosphatidylglycerophosphate/cardiolipin synthase-like enzyme